MSDQVSPHAGPPMEELPVLISGSGPVGLTLSILLSRQGVRNLVVEKRGKINTLPRARGLTVRSVEILSQLGLREQVDAIAIPSDWTNYFVYTQTVAGDLIGKMHTEAMTTAGTEKWSPGVYVVAAQDRIDPMLYDAAVAYPVAEVRFETEVVGYHEDSDGVVTVVRNANGTFSHIRSRYLIAADGGKSPLRTLAKIEVEGRASLRSFINNHVRADLSRFTKGREGALIWTLAPGREGVFQMLDGDRMWAIQVQYDPETFDRESWTEQKAVSHFRDMIGDPAAQDVEFEIIKTYPYTISTMVADKLRLGRLLLVGDAAHQVPPYGGFGLNTGIQTAHNLAWKLAAVLRGEAPDALLDTFDAERREVAMRVCQFGGINAGHIERLMQAVRSASSVEEKSTLVAASRQYGNWWGLDLGVHYECEGAFVPDDVSPPVVSDPVVDFVPHAKPGHRAPHFWTQRDGKRVSSVDLVDGGFLLLAGPQGQAWVEAARDAPAGSSPAVRAYRVATDGDMAPESDFCALYGVESSGAVLVRPDGHVAFRAPHVTASPSTTLSEVLDQVLRRKTAVPASRTPPTLQPV